jgi:predicted DNA binding protein
MREVEDARDLISKKNTRIEQVYAEYANECKRLGDLARKEKVNTGNLEYHKEAAIEYAEEVSSLNRKLNTALKNAPRERQAQIIATKDVQTQIDAAKSVGEELPKAEIRKRMAKAIEPARKSVGAEKSKVVFTDREWEAIQKGALPHTKVVRLLNNADEDDYKKRATPKERRAMTPSKASKAKSLAKAGYTLDEIAEYLGVSASTVGEVVNS